VYDVSDLDWTFTRRWNRGHLRRGLRRAVAVADLVLTSSSALPERLPAPRRPPHVVPNGCDPLRFAAEGPVSDKLTHLRPPLLGYAGAIDTRAFDGELVGAVARDHPEWTFVLIGPATPAGRAPLAGLPNVHFPGAVGFAEVPELLRSCDVCLIPYRVGGLIDYVHPKKLYEYLALGKPVVATRLPALAGLDVHLASSPAEFAAAIGLALESAGCPDAMDRRRRLAVRNSWAQRGRQVRALLTELEAARG